MLADVIIHDIRRSQVEKTMPAIYSKLFKDLLKLFL